MSVVRSPRITSPACSPPKPVHPLAVEVSYFIGEADTVFPNGYVDTAYRVQPSAVRPVELLARYLVSEISDLYNLESDDQTNLTRIIANLDVSAAHLADVTECFRELRAATEGARH